MKPRYLICKYKLKNIGEQIAFDKQRHAKLLIEWCDFSFLFFFFFFFHVFQRGQTARQKKLIRRSGQLIIEITKYFKYNEIEIVIETDEIIKCRSIFDREWIIINPFLNSSSPISNLKEQLLFLII